MAIRQHLAALELTSRKFNEWRGNQRSSELDLSGADLSGKNLQGFNLSEANLEGANLRGANLRQTRFQQASLKGACLCEAVMEGSSLEEADLVGADLSRANAQRARFNRSQMKGIICDDTNFTKALLESVDAENARFVGAILNEAKLNWINLKNADLRKSRFKNAELREASFEAANIAQADFFEANLTSVNLKDVVGAQEAKHLTTVTFASDARYFTSCVRAWQEKFVSWEMIRMIGNLRLFAVSYSLLAFLLTAFYVVGLYNEKVMIARLWAEDAQKLSDDASRLLAQQVLKGLDPLLFSWDTVLLFGATMLLVVASIIYTFGCPAEIKDFTRVQWRYQLNRSLVHYWAYAWQGRFWRLLCGAFYLVGGAMFVPIIVWKLLRALVYVAKYGNIFPMS